MSSHSRSGAARVKLLAVLGVIAMLLTAIGVALGGAAQADTNANPDTNTRAKFGPLNTATATVGLTPAGSTAPPAPGSTLAGAVEGSSVSIHVNDTSSTGGKLFGVNAARLCKSGLNITTASQMSPSNFGNCIPQPFTAGTDDDFVSVNADNAHTNVDMVFRVGSGSQTFTYNGGSSTITCDSTHPCAIWLQESVDTTIAGSGSIFKHYDVTYAGAPAAPTVTSTPGNNLLTIHAATPAASSGNSASPMSYTINLDNGGGSFTGTESTLGAGITHAFTATNFTQYTVTATAQSTAADGTTHFPSANGSAGPDATTTPIPAGPSNVQGTPGCQTVALTWTGASGSPDNYTVTANPTTPNPADNPQTTSGPATSYTFQHLAVGTGYTFTVVANYGTNHSSASSPSPLIVPTCAQITQNIQVTKPAGNLVLTQVCNTGVVNGVNQGAGAFGNQQAAPVYTGGPSPAQGGATVGAPDPLYAPTPGANGYPTGYPYPTDPSGNPIANYQTSCNINLGTAHLITSGPGKGQFYAASGQLNQVTIVDARDGSNGFNVTGKMSSFDDGHQHTFSGSELGWVPQLTSESGGFTDSDGNAYAQNVTMPAFTTGSGTQNAPACTTLPCKGATVPPNTLNQYGLSSGLTLAHADQNTSPGATGTNPGNCAPPFTGTCTTGPLGIATLDANLTLWIPINKASGTYTGLLTLSAV